MYRWAARAWKTLNTVEKQALLRSRVSTPLLPAFRPPPIRLTEAETTLLDTIGQRVGAMKCADTMNDVVKEYRLMGIETPTTFGGMGQSPYFHAKLIQRLATVDRDGNWLHRIMVPNSLGPSQLILQHGTEEQKTKYLSRLSIGEKIPCFGLTGPLNGSDAGAMPESGQLIDGGKTIRFSCDKRWITLSPISNLLGIAVRIRDKGITLLLVDTDELSKSDRSKITIYSHDPIGSSFPNGYIEIRDLEVPVESAVIGGPSQLGNGWSMLMDCLMHGRGISLPSAALGGTSSVLWHAVFYTSVRRQFNQRLIDLYGVQRMMTEIFLRWYLSDILNDYYHAALHANHKSSSLSALMKWTMTSMHREAVLHGMDVFGGKGITLGPKNPIAHFYLQNPVSITVEGSNCLTQHVIVPIQSIFEHHPYFFRVVESLEKKDGTSFYLAVASIIGDVTTSIFRYPISPAASRLALYQYRCLLEGSKLRKRQDLSRTLASLTVAHVMTEAIEWKFSSLSPTSPALAFVKSHLHRFVRDRWVQEKMMTDVLPGEAALLSEWILLDPDLFARLEKDLLYRDPSLVEVRDFWRSHNSFSIPDELHHRVIEVDRRP